MPENPTEGDVYEQANAVLRSLAAFSGLAQENMNRLTGWRFLERGRRTCRFARVFGEPGAPSTALDLLLELCDSQITYRSRYIVGLARLPVLDLVVLDASNPRSVAFQVERIEEHFAVLPGDAPDGRMTSAHRQAARLSTELRTIEPAALDAETLGAAEATFMSMSDEISQRFFTHRGPAPDEWEGLG